MYLVYVDDSSDDQQNFQVMTAVIMPDSAFMSIEEYLAGVIDEHISQDQRDSFEFHAAEMFHGKHPFEKLSRDESLKIFEKCADLLLKQKLKISYGAVDCHRLRNGIFATANPLDIGFRSCLKGIEKIFERLSVERRESFRDGFRELGVLDNPQFAAHIEAHLQENAKQRYDDFGILICDERKSEHHNLQKAFRGGRRRLKSSEHTRGILAHLHDDMYFGDSAYSVGIQLADICGFIILRHLKGKEDTDYLFKLIEPCISFSALETGVSSEVQGDLKGTAGSHDQ